MRAFVVFALAFLAITSTRALRLQMGMNANYSADPSHPYNCRPAADQITGTVKPTKLMAQTLSQVKLAVGIGKWTWVTPPWISGYFVAGMHATTAYGLESMLKGIKVTVATSERATGRSLLSDGFYMFSLGWKYTAINDKEAQYLAGDIKGELHHYATEAQATLKRAGSAPLGRGGNAKARAAMQASKQATGNQFAWTDKVYVVLGVKKDSLTNMKGYIMESPECADAYKKAKTSQDDNRYVEMGPIPDDVGYIIGPHIDKKGVELVAKQGLADKLEIIGYWCVKQKKYVRCYGGACADKPAHSLCPQTDH